MQVGLGQDQGPGLAQAFGEEGVLPGDKALQGAGARRGGHIAGAHVVLQKDGDAVQGAGEGPGLLEHPVQPVCLLQRPGIDGNDGVKSGPLLIIGFYARQIGLGQLPAGQFPLQHSLLNLADGTFHDGKCGHITQLPILVPVLPWIPSLAFSSRVIRALRPWPDSANWRAASTLGSMEPGAKCPSAI